MKAWCEITEKFNLANIRTRDKKQLINQWKCLKITSKKEISSYRREITRTGGGPKPPSPSPGTIEVAEMIPQEFEVDFNEFDCDGVQDITNQVIFEEIYKEREKKTKVSDTFVNENMNIRNDQDFPTEVIKDGPQSEHPITTPKKTTKKTPKASKDVFSFGEASYYADMHSFRVLENERMQKEHEQRMKNMAEIHNQVMVNLKLQSEILVKTLQS